MIKDGFLTIKDNKIYYKIYGYKINNIPLILVHGGPGVNHIYLETISDLSDERPVVLYDQLGCGYSDKVSSQESYNLDYYREELKILIENLGYEKVNLLGSSWGTIVVAEYVTNYESPVINKIILSGSCLDVSMWINDQRENMKKISEEYYNVIIDCEDRKDFSNLNYKKSIMEFYSKYLCRSNPWPEILIRSFEILNEDLYNNLWGPSEFTCTGRLKDYSILHKLKDIKVPVLYTVGEYDECTPATAELYKNNTPGSQLIVFPGASHTHHIEKQNEFNNTIRDFLK